MVISRLVYSMIAVGVFVFGGLPAQAQTIPAPTESCSCSASLKFDKPLVSWNGNSLVFVPTFDLSIRVRKNEAAQPWNLALNYNGQANFSSNDVPVPPNMSFAGSETWSGTCVNTRFNFRGHAGEPVTLAQLTRNLFTNKKELAGTVNMQGALTGCDQDSENRGFKLTVGDLGKLKMSSWRLVR